MGGLGEIWLHSARTDPSFLKRWLPFFLTCSQHCWEVSFAERRENALGHLHCRILPEPRQLTGCEIALKWQGSFLVRASLAGSLLCFPRGARLPLILVLAWPLHREGLWEQASLADLPMPLGNFRDCYINPEHHTRPQPRHQLGLLEPKAVLWKASSSWARKCVDVI